MSIPMIQENVLDVGQRNFLAAILPILFFVLKVFTVALGLVMFIVHMSVVIFFGTVNLFLRMVFH